MENKTSLQEIQTVTKDIQKIVLKAICDFPTLNVEELTTFLKNKVNKITQDEVQQVIHSISPNKNWHRASQEEVQNEIITYTWTLENQILFLFPAKQKETNVAEFNQFRLQNKQSKVPKDLIRHIQSSLSVENKNLNRFRRFQKELTLQNDFDINIQAMWLLRIILASLNISKINNIHALSNELITEMKNKFPGITEKISKTSLRICERLTEKYFSKNVSETRLKELISQYQSTYNSIRKASEGELELKSENKDQNKLIECTIDDLREIQEIVSKSGEGGIISKLFAGKIKNQDVVIKKIDEVINSLNQLNDLNNKTNKATNEKALLVQKLQSDYENILFIKNQLERDLFSLNEKISITDEKNNSLDKELKEKSEQLEKLYEKAVSLQKRVDEIPELESTTSTIKEELITAKNLSLNLYARLIRLKSDLLKLNSDKPKQTKPTSEQKPNNNNGSQGIHKLQQNSEEVSLTI